jgi:uncharacterized protein YkwD
MSFVMIETTNDLTQPPPTSRRTRPMVTVLLTALLGVALLACTDGPGAANNHAAINGVRARAGLPELVRSPELDAKAVAQANRMASRGTIYHSKNLASGVSGGWQAIGENVALAGSVDQAQAALEASPGHYANMVNPAFNQVGIGVVSRGGVVYVVQVFVSR